MTDAVSVTAPVKSADRVLELIEFLAAAPTRPTLTQLATQLGIPKSSLHGLLRTMAGRGWVCTDETGTRFGLGPRALQVGVAYLASDPTVDLLGPVLDELADLFGETVHLGRLDEGEMVYLAKRESAHPLRLVSAVGKRVPTYATALGKAVLAQRDDAAVTALLPPTLHARTPRTHTSLVTLFEDLAVIRVRGYAVDEEENRDEVVCFAVAPALATPPTDAISISVPTSRLTAELRTKIPAALLQTAARLAPARGVPRQHAPR